MSRKRAKIKGLLDEEDRAGNLFGFGPGDNASSASAATGATQYSYNQPSFSTGSNAASSSRAAEKETAQATLHSYNCPCCIGSAQQISTGTSGAGVASSGSDPYYVTNLKSGAVWANSGSGVTISYKFWTALPGHYSSSDAESKNFQAFTAAMKTATKEILGQISAFTKINFVEVASDSSAQLGFAQARLTEGTGAWAYYPSTAPKGGDVWTNNLYASQTQNVTKGGYGYFVLLHEIGHALGLKHSFSGPNSFTGEEDSSRYTVMSYTWPFYSISYMLYDIAALQSLYGANTGYNSGNDTYTLQSGKGYAIWDTGGTDTLDSSAIGTSVTIDLREGHYSSVGVTKNIAIAYDVVIENAVTGGGNDIIYDNGANNEISSGSGNDTVYLTGGNDIADGGAGTDTAVLAYRLEDYSFTTATDSMVVMVHAAAGTDTLRNFERFTFTNGTYTAAELAAFADPDVPVMTTEFRWSKAVFKSHSFTTGSDLVSAAAMAFKGVTGNLFDIVRDDEDTMSVQILNKKAPGDIRFTIADEGAEITLWGVNNKAKTIFNGGDGDDRYTVADSIKGNDKVYGGDGDDVLSAGEGSDTIYGGNGADEIFGGGGNDTIWGGVDNDVLYGGAGNDKISGNSGNDILNGGPGKDTLTGGAGSDTFIFSVLDKQTDAVTDFTRTGGQADKIDISDVLSGYDPLTDNINNFVKIQVNSAGKATLKVNADGAGGGWVTVATISGQGLSGMTVDELFNNGQLIAD